MRKYITLVCIILFVLSMGGCGEKEYKLTIADNYPVINELQETYSAGEEITIKLYTVTEQYYRLFVNGEKQHMDKEKSDMLFTYFIFTMPENDVIIEIEECGVDIPER